MARSNYTLDAKNRLTVPAKLRAALADGVVLAKGVERDVGIWKPSDYESLIEATLAGQNPMSPQARELQRYFSSGAFDTELDAAGRVMIPSLLIDHAGLDRGGHGHRRRRLPRGLGPRRPGAPTSPIYQPDHRHHREP